MDIYKNIIKERLDKEEKYRELLFRRGYLLTDAELSVRDYPFYGLWSEARVGPFRLYVHQTQTWFVREKHGMTVALIGHAYDPFDGKYSEDLLCEDLLDCANDSLSSYFDKISELTGLHVIFLLQGSRLIGCQDACSLTGCYFGCIDGKTYVAEHPQLIADLCGLKMDKNVEKLVQSKCYNIGNRHLPGNKTPYREVKRLGTNTYLQAGNGEMSIHRFFPVMAHPEYTTEAEIADAVKRVGTLIHAGIECCTKKWDRCSISLSGGTDSKTTLACANGLYDRFQMFSYHCKPQELVDAKGAKQICDRLGLPHTLYDIPEENSAIPDFDFLRKLTEHNTNYFMHIGDHELRKFLFFHDLDAYDVELKSWASEVTRVFFERKYQIRMPKVLNERQCSILQTRFFGHPKLLRWSDRAYYDFLREIGLEKPLYNYEHADLFYWEVRMGCWGVTVISSQQLHHRLSVPMNNRKILELMLSMPRELRKTDTIHKMIMQTMNADVVEAGVEIPNLYFHSYRIWMEKIFFLLRTKFYRPMRER